MQPAAPPATIGGQLRFGAGFGQDDRDAVVERLGSLDTRLATFPADGTELELSVKDRDRPGQKVTLECWIAGQKRLVATSAEREMADALADVRDDLRRQLDDAKTRTEPRNNRQLRS